MRRKLVKQGAATLMVSLPSKWARRFNLEKGSSIEVIEKNDSLILTPEAQSSKKEQEITITSETESSIRVLLTNFYRSGYDKIKINFPNENSFINIKNVASNLIGWEIVQKNKNFCVIENITEPSREKFETIFMKVIYNIDHLFDILNSAFTGNKNYGDYKEIELRIKKYDDFCRRILTKHNILENIELRWNFHNELIHAQRDLYYLIVYLEKNKVKISKEEINFLSSTEEMYKLLKEYYNNREVKILEKMHLLEKNLVYTKGYNLLKDKNIIDKVIVMRLISAIRTFYFASSPLTGEKIN